MTPCLQDLYKLKDVNLDERAEDVLKDRCAEAMDNIARKREQKLLNAVGAHLNKETLSIEEVISLKGRMRCEVNKADQSESFYLDDTLLVTFLQPEFIVEGSAIMVKQAYGPVGV